MEMKGMNAVIAGGSSGIGLGIARNLVQNGCHVWITGRDGDKLARVQSELGPCLEVVQGDLSSPEGCMEQVDDLKTAMKGEPVDFLVYCAAVYQYRSLIDESASSVVQAFQTNVFSAFHLAKGLHSELLKGHGKSVLFISSTLSTRPVAGTGIYSASKAALDSLVSSLAVEWASQGIRVNSILPGVVDTPIHEPKAPGDPTRSDKMKQFSGLHPLGRVGEVEDITRAALFLLAPESSWITGVKWPVDGGISLV